MLNCRYLIKLFSKRVLSLVTYFNCILQNVVTFGITNVGSDLIPVSNYTLSTIISSYIVYLLLY